MTITIQRGRQFAAGDAQVQLFEEDGDAGSYLTKASEKLAAQNVTITVGEGARQVTLRTAADWRTFLAANCSTKAQTERFVASFGITFSDFANVVDDAAASADTGVTIDLRPGSSVAKALSVDRIDGDYGGALAKGAQVALGGGSTAAPATAVAAGVPTIGPAILATAIGSSWERDRTEQESWADFRNTGSASDRFRELTGPAPYAKLYQPKWSDPEAMAIVNEFALPLHLEVARTPNPDGSVRFQDGNEMFRDSYFEDRNGALGKAGASVRTRVRFDNTAPFAVNRQLVQAKEGRQLNGAASAVHKFEKRSWSGTPTEEDLKSMLVNGVELVNGRTTGTLEVSQKLYKLAKDQNTLGPDDLLQLEEKYIVLQKRRRTHLQLDSVGEVQSRRTAVKQEADALTAAGSPIPPALTKYLAKLDSQIEFLNKASTTLRKYGQWAGSGECFIISADRYNVYDPTARKGSVPTDISDEVGRIGKGPLHVEAEWDSASSDSFENAIEEIDKRLAATPAPSQADIDTLKADRASIESMREVFRGDVAKTVEVLRAKLTAAGLREDTAKKSKDQRAADIANAPNRPQFWF